MPEIFLEGHILRGDALIGGHVTYHFFFLHDLGGIWKTKCLQWQGLARIPFFEIVWFFNFFSYDTFRVTQEIKIKNVDYYTW
jgi:hypothetical protein